MPEECTMDAFCVLPAGHTGQHSAQRPDSRSLSDPWTCEACGGSGAQLCECDRGERPIVNCYSCSGRECVDCGGSGHKVELVKARCDTRGRLTV